MIIVIDYYQRQFAHESRHRSSSYFLPFPHRNSTKLWLRMKVAMQRYEMPVDSISRSIKSSTASIIASQCKVKFSASFFSLSSIARLLEGIFRSWSMQYSVSLIIMAKYDVGIGSLYVTKGNSLVLTFMHCMQLSGTMHALHCMY